MSGLPHVAHWRNAIRDSDLDRTAKLVGFVLSTYMDGNGRNAYAAKTTLARGASLGRKAGQKDNTAVGNAIDRLEAAGLLAVDRRRGRRGFRYTAVIPRWYEGFKAVESPTQPGDYGPLNPPQNGAKSPTDWPEIPRPGGGESAESAESVTSTRARRAGKKNAHANAREDIFEAYNR